jgi:hypothetical protein
MLRRILILDKQDLDNNYFTVRYRLLLDVPVIQQKISEAVLPISSKDSNVDEITAADNKSIIEKNKSANFVYGTEIEKIQKALEDDFKYEQSLLDYDTKWELYGMYWDGASWVKA